MTIDNIRIPQIPIAPAQCSLLEELRKHNEGMFKHSQRVAALMYWYADTNGLPSETYYKVGLLHDVGKVCVPNTILDKPGKLTEEEREIINTHSECGYIMLKSLDPICAEAARHHHDNIETLANSNPLIYTLQLIDIFDALCSERPYRGPVPVHDTVTFLERKLDDAHVSNPRPDILHVLGGVSY